jgi:hypothetical protein
MNINMRDLRFSQRHIPEYSSLQEGDTVPLCGYMTSQTTPIFIFHRAATPQTEDRAPTVRCLRWYNVHKLRENL